MRSAILWPTLVALGIACYSDIRSRRIPNLLVLPYLLSGLAADCYLFGWSGLSSGLQGIALAMLICGPFCYLRGMGMGDLKLCAAVGAWIGPRQLAFALVMTFVSGALIGIAWAIGTRSLSRSLSNTGDLLLGFARNGIRPHDSIVLDNPNAFKIPYAPAIALGTLVSFLAF